jgi:hypothetical protein
VKDLDAETLNARLVGGHRLLVTRGLDDRVVACAVEFFGERVPVRGRRHDRRPEGRAGLLTQHGREEAAHARPVGAASVTQVGTARSRVRGLTRPNTVELALSLSLGPRLALLYAA